MKKANKVGEKYLTNSGHTITIIEYFNKMNCTVQFEDGVIVKSRRFNNIKKGSVKKPISRAGEKFINNQGYEAEITTWINSNNCTVKFIESGEIVENVTYFQVKTKSIKRPKSSKLGEVYTTTEGYKIQVVEYFNSQNVSVAFEDGFVLRNRSYLNIKQGEVKNPNHRSVHRIGYFGIGKYIVKENRVYFNKWKEMIRRCYSERHQERQPTYKECTVAEEWHNFQIFAEWMESNYNPKIMQGWQLDKDILVKGNKVYSPETCCFVPSEVNLLFVKNDKVRGSLPIGVRKSGRKFYAKLFKNKKQTELGSFYTAEEAFKCYKFHKEQYIKEVADKWKDQLDPRVYEAMYNYQVEITD
jgi:hypothetical protein